ncbi:zinc finger CCHC domain-containing protein 7 [Notolabrus celidotus]|uniref:zinc finger CCHC domain-containing protein 7 n=1 Tax=Notolabrus celidotus TaxID=1203425 RepID=UPI00148F6249|nr:zinc finger CCHC domain-containing protein 7 [Notolabrus celidotus]XP_034543876.1 zinc finger CCHC domain-containing protein 7 [Notolabrus celidotus]
MNCMYQDREELEDELYQEDDADADGSEADSELEFHLYSQLHYSSNAGKMEEQEEKGEVAESQDNLQTDVAEKTRDGEQEHSGESRPQSPDINALQRYLKKRAEKRDKQKKRESNSKSQGSSSLYEEVIVIDSGPDVISISEGDTSDDDDEGVCALKGQGGRPQQTSTPAGQGTQKKKRSINGPVAVSSSSDSDSEESESESSNTSDSSDSSDSDDLENWMILGPGKQDGDHSISLNLEGGSDSNADVEGDGSWLVSAKDREAQIYNKDKGARIAVQRLPNRYYTNKSVQCRNCNKYGHLSKNCPEPKKLLPCFLCGTPGHLSNECPNRHCNNCGLPGHLYDSCNERAYWHKQCHRCSMTGHFFDACPEIWRQYHITTEPSVPVKQQEEDQGKSPAHCYNCSRKGHFGYACTRQRMFNGTYPCTPFINHYDSKEDINRRQHRVKMKIKDLKQHGLFPAGTETPLTPGPPKKRQKVDHHKNNHKHNHTPHQSNNNHKSNRTHIFFKDNHDFKAPAAKLNKHHKFKQPESAGNVKPWKPKRPVPTSREPPPKLVLDEADDFPRGGAKADNTVMKKKRKRVKKIKPVPSGPPGGHGNSRADRSCWTARGEFHGSKQEKGENKRKRRNWGKGDYKKNAQMYPTDENLFIIKQKRKSSR